MNMIEHKTGEYYFNFLSEEDKKAFLEKQHRQGRNSKHYFTIVFMSFSEFITGAFLLVVSDYKFWSEIANLKVE